MTEHNIRDTIILETLMVIVYNLKLKTTPFSCTHQLPLPELSDIPSLATNPLIIIVIKITHEALQTIYHHAEATFPEECCGFLSSPDPDGIVTEPIECTNIQNKLHEEDPVEYPRTAEDAYFIDGMEFCEVDKSVSEKGHYLVGTYHSHTDKDAYFSEEDRRLATFHGKPIWSEAHYIVVSVMEGKVAYSKSFRWDAEEDDFDEEEMDVLEKEST